MINIKLVEQLKRFHFVRKMVLQKKISFDFPVRLNIEPTNYCNLSCSMCPRELNRSFGYMDIYIFQKIINESVLYGKRLIITINKDGEPLLHPELPQMIKYAKDKKAAHKINFYTNGILLTEAKSSELIKSGLDTIHISIDAFTKETYKKVKNSQKLEVVEENVKRLVALKKKLQSKTPLVVVKIIQTPDTQNEIKPFIHKWKGIADFVEIGEYHNWDGTLNGTSPPNLKNLLEGTDRYPCTFLWYNPVILWDGRVTTCCVDYQGKGIIGDIKEETLAEIWQGDTLQRIRDAHLENNYDSIPLCSNCQFWRCEVNIEKWLRKVNFPRKDRNSGKVPAL
ncbi:radical SAM protein [Candidatus Kuenenia stuttgartensis]|nr:radical SAM protein [Candidatus Kuenenia stuttgartiensis]